MPPKKLASKSLAAIPSINVPALPKAKNPLIGISKDCRTSKAVVISIAIFNTLPTAVTVVLFSSFPPQALSVSICSILFKNLIKVQDNRTIIPTLMNGSCQIKIEPVSKLVSSIEMA